MVLVHFQEDNNTLQGIALVQPHLPMNKKGFYRLLDHKKLHAIGAEVRFSTMKSEGPCLRPLTSTSCIIKIRILECLRIEPRTRNSEYATIMYKGMHTSLHPFFCIFTPS